MGCRQVQGIHGFCVVDEGTAEYVYGGRRLRHMFRYEGGGERERGREGERRGEKEKKRSRRKEEEKEEMKEKRRRRKGEEDSDEYSGFPIPVHLKL